MSLTPANLVRGARDPISVAAQSVTRGTRIRTQMASPENRCDDYIHLRGARRPGTIQLCCLALRATKRASDTRLHGKQILPLRGVQANARAGWQLQHGRVLTFAQVCQEHDLAVGELQGIMMDV
jgi:hypothetical protein